MIKFVVIGIALTCSSTVALTQKSVKVFISGTEGNKVYRIPAIVSLPDGSLLAFCESRVNDAGDFGDINIVSKRSKDGGKTWGSLQMVVDYDTLQAGNPAPVVDLDDPRYRKGRIFLFYNTGNNHEGEVRKGKGLREVWYKTSTDNGATWSEPVNITMQVHRPRQPQVNSSYNFPEDWRSYANAPGHAMQFTSGQYKGRIFVPANHSAGEPQNEFGDYLAHGFYTDDHGETFQLGKSVNIPGANESTAAQLSSDKLIMNIRNQRGDIRARIVAISSTGGATWDTAYFDNKLPDPVCQGSILTIGKTKGKNILAFCNAADLKHRDNLTLRISLDDGKTWTRNYLIDKSYNENAKDHSAYSDLVKLNKKAIGILYEKNNYSEIVFVKQYWK
jgi:sialidase-1